MVFIDGLDGWLLFPLLFSLYVGMRVVHKFSGRNLFGYVMQFIEYPFSPLFLSSVYLCALALLTYFIRHVKAESCSMMVSSSCNNSSKEYSLTSSDLTSVLCY